MRFFTARRLALLALLPALLSFSLIPGCSQQGEGERCGDDQFGTADSDDCASNLVCTPSQKLINGSVDHANRCCSTSRVTDSRCQPVGTIVDVPDAAGAAGETSSVVEAGAGGSR